MAMLTEEAFDSARRFLEATARPLELARFRHVFEGGAGQLVIHELRKFQNPDGGFGHALDPDLRAPESSVLCTSIAFQIIRATQANPDPAIISGAVAYLLNNMNEAAGCWRIIPASAEFSPHAPWWRQTGRNSAFDGFSLNPAAEILGYLYDYQEHVPSDLPVRLSALITRHVSSIKKIEMHDLLSCLRLLQTRSLPETLRSQLAEMLVELVDGAVTWEPALWEGYNLRPLQVIDDPESSFLAGRQEQVAANLDYEIRTQNRDGSWAPTWSWGDSFPDDWPNAKRECAGMITLEKLLLLYRFGRIERASGS